MSDALVLYQFVPFDRAGRVLWLARELGLEVEVRRLDFTRGESKTPEFLGISPGGTVPALETPDGRLFESGAALQHLAEVHAPGTMIPMPGDPGRAEFLSWMYLASATLDPLAFEFVRPDLAPDEVEPRREHARRRIGRRLRALAGLLGEKPTLLEAGFGVLDIQVAACLHYAEKGGCLEDHPALAAYLQAMRDRPAARESGLFGG